MFENIGSMVALREANALYQACVDIFGVPSIEEVADSEAGYRWNEEHNFTSTGFAVGQAASASGGVVMFVLRQYQCAVVRRGVSPHTQTEVFFYGRSYAPELLIAVPEDALMHITVTPQGGGETTTAWMLFHGKVIA